MNLKQKRILVLGGTGAMGNHLVNILSLEGYLVYVTTRSSRQCKGNVIYLRGDAHELSFLRQILDEWRFDCIVDFMVYTTNEFAQRYSMLLCATSQYVFLSSARVYAQSIGCPITEESPRLLDVCKDEEYLRTDDYALAKARQENILYGSKEHNWTIIRPYITYSEIRLQLGVFEKEDWLFRALHNRSIVLSKDIAPHFTALTHGYDVAKGIAGVIRNPRTLGETFNIVTSESHTWEEIANLYLNVLKEITGKQTGFVIVDSCFFVKDKLAKFSVKYSRLFDYHFDNSKILQFVPDLQFRPTLGGLHDCLQTFVASPSFRKISPTVQANLDKDAGEHMPLSRMASPRDKAAYLFHRYMPSCVLDWRKKQVRSKNDKKNML